VIVLSNTDHPLVGVQVHFGGGSSQDPIGKEGLAYLTGQLLMRGTVHRTHAELAEAIDRLGAVLQVSVSREHIAVEGEVLTRHLTPFLDVLLETLSEPAFPEEQLEQLKRQTAAYLDERRDNDETLVRDVFLQWVHQPDPIARPTVGTQTSIACIDREDVLACARRTLTTKNHRIYAAGDITESMMQERVAGPLADLTDGGALSPPSVHPAHPSGVRVVLVDKPERTQSQIMIGHPVIEAAHADHLALSVGNMIFGGTFTARLSHEIREKRGWSYGAYSQLLSFRHSGTFAYRYYPALADTSDALALGLDLLQTLVSDGVTDEEVSFAKRTMVNRFAFRVETPWSRLDEAIRAQGFGLPPDHLDTMVARIQALDADTVNRVLRKYLFPSDLRVVVVCTADGLEKNVAQLAAVDGVYVHPYKADWPADGALG